MQDEIVYVVNPYTADPNNVDISDSRLRKLYDDKLKVIKVYQQYPQYKTRCLEILQSIDYQRKWILHLRSLIYDPVQPHVMH